MGEKGLAEAVGSTASPGIAEKAATMVAHGAANLGTDVVTAVKTTAVVAVADQVVRQVRERHNDDDKDDDQTTPPAGEATAKPVDPAAGETPA